MLLEITERELAPDITVLELSGKLALGRESQRLEALVNDLIKRGSLRVILDMSGVNYLDSAGIGLLALANGKLKDSGGKMAVVAEGRTLELLTMTQMTAIMDVSPTIDAAASNL
ncbi:MAG: STAS domain-containing protein [Candidatus Solibacter sp.]